MDTDLQELFIGHWQQLPYLDCVELWEGSSIRQDIHGEQDR